MSDMKLKIARETRAAFEDWSIDESLLRKLYLEYQEVPYMDDFLSQAKSLFPKLNCGLASVYLQEKLGGEIVKGFYMNNRHTFLVSKGLIVDITADQYGGPEIYVGPVCKPWIVS